MERRREGAALKFHATAIKAASTSTYGVLRMLLMHGLCIVVELGDDVA